MVSLKNQHFQKELFRQFGFFVTHIHIRRFDKRKVVSEIKYTQEENLSGGQLSNYSGKKGNSSIIHMYVTMSKENESGQSILEHSIKGKNLTGNKHIGT